jgi:hypothetical protein
MNKKIFIVMIFCVWIASAVTYAQPNIQIEWQRTIGGSNTDNMYSVMQTPDGGYILGGMSTSGISGEKTEANRGPAPPIPILATGDYWIVKVNDTGGIQWQRTYGGTNYDSYSSMDLTSDGGYIVAGNSNSPVSGEKTDTSRGVRDFWILKLNDTGGIQWQKTIGGSKDDMFQKIIQTVDGGYMLAGFSNSPISGNKTEANRSGGTSPFNDYWAVKLDSTGVIQWQKTIGGADDDRLYDMVATPDGGYLLGGTSRSGISGEKTQAPAGGSDFWIVKLSSTGAIQWDKTIGGSGDDSPTSLYVTADSGYVLAGQSFSGLSGDKTDTSRGSSDYWILKTSSTGVIQWQKTYGGDGYDWATNIIQTDDGGFMVHGNSASGLSGEKTEMGWGSEDYWVLKLGATGGIQWQRALGGNATDMTFHSGLLLQTPDGKYVVGGYAFSGISGNKTDTSRGGFGDYWILKIFEDCPDTTFITGTICPDAGYTLPWGMVTHASGTFNYGYNIGSEKCDSTVSVTLTNLVDTAVNVIDSTLTAVAGATTYQWLDCNTGQLIPGATSATYTVPQGTTGSYAVIVTTNGCTDTSNCHALSTLGIHNPELNQFFNIYPNPANTRVVVENKADVELQRISVTNILGAEVLSYNQIKGQRKTIIDVRSLAPAVYLLRVQTNKGMLIHKMEILR